MNIFHYLVRIKKGLLSRARNYWFRILGVNISGYVWMQAVSIPRNWSDINLAKGVALDDGVVLLCSGDAKRGKISIGKGTYINRYTMLDAHSSIEIGENCMIGPQCYITDGDHGTAQDALINAQAIKTSPVKIEDNVWIGAGSVILKGVTIGKGAVIGAGSVVTKSIEANTVALGIPATYFRNK